MFFGPEAKWRDRAIVHTAELFYLLKSELPHPGWPLGMFPAPCQFLRMIIKLRIA